MDDLEKEERSQEADMLLVELKTEINAACRTSLRLISLDLEGFWSSKYVELVEDVSSELKQIRRKMKGL